MKVPANDLKSLFIPPDNPDIAIWRYMDFGKFTSMLHLKGLYFPRADKLGDSFEGSVPPINQTYLSEALNSIMGKVEAGKFIKKTTEVAPYFRAWVFINSWNMSDSESMAMWKIYSGSNKSIAIKSTYKKLRETLPKTIHIGIVKYIDYDSEPIPSGNILNLFMHKRKVFEFEKELRAVRTGKFPAQPEKGQEGILSLVGIEEGVTVHIELDNLVDAIYISPAAEQRFIDVVESVSQKFGLNKTVYRSSIDTLPVFGL